MSSTDWFKSFVTQYLISFTILMIMINLSCYLNFLVSILGKTLVILSICWFMTKLYRKRFNKILISPNKKAVIVTGCDTGFGNELAHKLNELGFRVYATVFDPNCAGAKNLIANARYEGKTKVIGMDITNDTDVNRVYKQIIADLHENCEQLWALVNNAGIFTIGPVDWGTIDGYKRIFEVNTFGTIRVTRTFLPLIRKSKGRIVNLTSVSGRTTFDGIVNYSMSKHAITSFSDGLRIENNKFGIKVSTVEPAPFKTPLTAQENFERQVDLQWDQSSDDVKQLYGEEFRDNLKKFNEFMNESIFKPSDKLNKVIDAIIDAIQNQQPDIVYQVIPNLITRLYFCLLDYLPQELCDYLILKAGPKNQLSSDLK